jgi:transcriptional regulator with XRE-family HTH domain
MPAERLSMRQIREVLRLRFASELPQRAIAKSLGLSQGAVSRLIQNEAPPGALPTCLVPEEWRDSARLWQAVGWLRERLVRAPRSSIPVVQRRDPSGRASW